MLLDDVEVMGNLTLRKEQQLITYSEDHTVTYHFLTPLPSPVYSPEAMLMAFEVAPTPRIPSLRSAIIPKK